MGRGPKRSDIAEFIRNERDATTHARVFLFTAFRQLQTLDKAAGGHLPTDVIKRLIEKFDLVGPRGGSVTPSYFRAVWNDVKREKNEDVVSREARKLRKADWRGGFVERPTAERHPIGDAPARNRGPPAVGAAQTVDLDAFMNELFAAHRARLPPMPSPKPITEE